MKKFLIGLCLFLLTFLVVGCGQTVDNPTIECEDFLIIVGETYVVSPTSNVNKAKYQYTLEGTCASISNNAITANEAGTATLTIKIDGYDITKVVNITCAEEGIAVIGSKTVVINETVDLKAEFIGIPEDDLTWRSSNNNVARVSQGTVTGIALGKFTITVKTEDYSTKFEMEVVRPTATEIVVENNKEEVVYEIGATYELSYSVKPELALQDVKIESNSDVLIIGEDNKIKANKNGEAILKITSLSNESVIKNVKVKVVENEAPVFTKQSDFEENIKVNFGNPVSATQGLKIIDNSDGDITELVTVENAEDLQKLGTREITLVATDRAGNKATFKRNVTVEWQYNTKFIGHQGCFYAVPNTEEAFRYAASVMQYQALECDLKSTKDGVLVICHDDTFGGMNVSTHTYAELSTVVATSKQFGCPQTYYGSKTYTGHICKFETYLDICAEYNVMPIIELKGAYGMDSGNTSQLLPLMKLLRDKGLYETSVILTSMGDCISFLRKKGETVKCQYLVKGASSDTVLDFCITNKCDVSVNVTYGNSISDEYIKKYHDAGCEISVWTFTSYCDYNQVQEWIDKGVDYLTCDWHYLTEGKLTFK